MLAVTSSKRVPELPNVATVAETLPGFEVVSWWGVVAPHGTPAAIVAQLNGELAKALMQPDMIRKLTAVGMTAAPGTPQQLGTVITTEVEKWTRVARQTKIDVE
jgi:tripartite-type tricarboxylate transporter receptor subunit TctC